MKIESLDRGEIGFFKPKRRRFWAFAVRCRSLDSQRPDLVDQDALVSRRATRLAGQLTLDLVQLRLQVIGTLKDEIDDRRGDLDLIGSRAVEQALHFVGHGLNGVEGQKSGQPLDGVKGAKDRVKRLHLARILLELEHAAFNRCEVLARLEEKVANQLGIFTEGHRGWRSGVCGVKARLVLGRAISQRFAQRGEPVADSLAQSVFVVRAGLNTPGQGRGQFGRRSKPAAGGPRREALQLLLQPAADAIKQQAGGQIIDAVTQRLAGTF